MTRLHRFFGTTVLLALFALVLSLQGTHVAAQSAPSTRVQQDSQRLDVATAAAYSRTSAATITLPAQGGQYIYVTGIDISNCAGGTAVTAAAPTYITTTNLSGSPQYQIGSGVTAGLCTSTPAAALTTVALKSAAPGTAVTFVLPTFATNQTVSVNVYFYYAQ